jgi:hypothetical protein
MCRTVEIRRDRRDADAGTNVKLQRGDVFLNARKLRQKQKKRNASNDEKLCITGRLFGYNDPTAQRAIKKMK